MSNWNKRNKPTKEEIIQARQYCELFGGSLETNLHSIICYKKLQIANSKDKVYNIRYWENDDKRRYQKWINQ